MMNRNRQMGGVLKLSNVFYRVCIGCFLFIINFLSPFNCFLLLYWLCYVVFFCVFRVFFCVNLNP